MTHYSSFHFIFHYSFMTLYDPIYPLYTPYITQYNSFHFLFHYSYMNRTVQFSWPQPAADDLSDLAMAEPDSKEPVLCSVA